MGLRRSDSVKPRLLFLLHLPPPVHGSTVVGRCIRESRVITDSFECDFVNVLTSRSMQAVGKAGVRKLLHYLRTMGVLTQKLLSAPYDLCYMALATHGWAFRKDALLVGLVKLFQIPMVYHLHNKGISARHHQRWDDYLYRRVFHDSSVILLSRHLYGDIQKYVRPARVYYCANGIVPREDSGWWPPRLETPPTILFLSNLIESKGVLVLLEACRLLKEKGDSFTCRFVGTPSDITRERFEAQVSAQGLADCVVYEGGKYGREKDRCLRDADIFALPTFEDCFPLVVLEAMQAALPVVSTYEGGIPEIVEDGRTGFLCPPRDPRALARKLEILIGDPALRKAMGEAGRCKYEAEFTLARFEQCLLDILRAILQERRPTEG